MGNVIEVNLFKAKSDKEKKQELKIIEKKLKTHQKKSYPSDEEKWELEDRQAELNKDLEDMKTGKKEVKAK